MKLAYHCIGPDRLCVISDSTSGAGLPEGTHIRMGRMEYYVSDGVGMLLDRTAFAGSTTLLNEMIPSGKPPLISGAEGKRSLAIILAIYQSAGLIPPLTKPEA